MSSDRHYVQNLTQAGLISCCLGKKNGLPNMIGTPLHSSPQAMHLFDSQDNTQEGNPSQSFIEAPHMSYIMRPKPSQAVPNARKPTPRSQRPTEAKAINNNQAPGQEPHTSRTASNPSNETLRQKSPDECARCIIMDKTQTGARTRSPPGRSLLT